MLFGLVKDKDAEIVSVETVSGEAEEKALPADEEAAKQRAERAANVRFSSRIASTFSRMYRFIISADLTANVYQIESGSATVGDREIPVRGKYDEAFEHFLFETDKADRDRLKSAFSKDSLRAAFEGDSTTVSGTFAFAKSTEDTRKAGEDMYRFYSVRAERIPADDTKRIRALIFIKKITGSSDDGRIPERSEEPVYNWKELRARKLLEGDSVFFEYNVKEDTMYAHQYGKVDGTSVTKNYLRTMTERCDWTLCHEDNQKFRDCIAKAIKGQRNDVILKYRINGDHKNPFHYHRMIVAPAEDFGEVRWVVGAFTDVDEKANARRRSSDIAVQMSKFMSNMYSFIYEIDIAKDELFVIKAGNEGFVRASGPESFTKQVVKNIKEGVIHPDYAEMYKKASSKGFLRNHTIYGPFEFDALIRPQGAVDYRWRRETFFKMEGEEKYLRFSMDATEIHKAMDLKFEVEREKHDAETSRRLMGIMAGLVEFRNMESGIHIINVSKLTKILLNEVKDSCPEYNLTENLVNLYADAAIMHDIGKIAVPQDVLNKPGVFTPDERDVMQHHVIDGENIIMSMKMPGQEKLIECCRQVARSHHERWDGSGYPDGLKGEQIPIGVQVVGLVDAYDALVSERCYKSASPHDEAVYRILQGDCGAFNPKLLDCLKAVAPEFERVYENAEPMEEEE